MAEIKLSREEEVSGKKRCLCARDALDTHEWMRKMHDKAREGLDVAGDIEMIKKHPTLAYPGRLEVLEKTIDMHLKTLSENKTMAERTLGRTENSCSIDLADEKRRLDYACDIAKKDWMTAMIEVGNALEGFEHKVRVCAIEG